MDLNDDKGRSSGLPQTTTKKPPPQRQSRNSNYRSDQEEEKKSSGNEDIEVAINDGRSILSSSTTATTKTAAAAALLDQQIEGQRQKGVNNFDDNAGGKSRPDADADRAFKQKAKAARMSAVSSGAYRKPPPPGSVAAPASSAAVATARDMSDAMAKSRGRRNAGAKNQQKRPVPAHLRDSSTGGHRNGGNTGSKNQTNTTKLERLEEEVAAKARGKAPTSAGARASVTKRNPPGLSPNRSQSEASSPGSSFTAVKRMNRMEADIAAKEQSRASRGSGDRPAGKRLDRLEADVAAKERAKASRVTGKKASAIARKLAKNQQQRGAPATVPGAVSSTEGGGRAALLAKKKRNVAASVAATGTSEGAASSKLKKAPPSHGVNHLVGGEKQPKHESPDASDGGAGGPTNVPPGTGGTEVGGRYESDSNNGLAVAVAVRENEDVFIPSAVEYDPDAIKYPVYKNQRVRVYGLLFCILLIIVTACTIGVLTILQRQDDEQHHVPTESPTCARCTLDYIEQLELEVGSQKLNDPESPEYLAKEWIIHEDEMQLLPTDLNFIQRFIMAAFYFDTHQVAPWRSCNQQSIDLADNETEKCDFLKLSGIKPLVFEAFPANRWLSSVHECEWAGVICDNLMQIRVIDLHGQGIEGTFPSSFQRLRYVQTVAMQWNNFTGPLPGGFGQMKYLIHVEMHNNRFTGSFPNSWSSARNLQLLNVAENFLTGQIPTSVGNFRNIKGLFLFRNQFSGTLPPEFSNTKSLAFMRFHKNELTGTIPPEFGDMHVNELWLHNNELTGTLPTELGKLTNYLTDIRMSETSLEGTIPEEIFKMSQLWRLDLHKSKFTGTISPNITKLEGLQTLRLSSNGFTGTLPSDFSSMTNLRTVWLDGNNLSGTIPSSICDLKEEHILEFVQADCLPDPSSGQPLVTCECCDVCCSAETGACQF